MRYFKKGGWPLKWGNFKSTSRQVNIFGNASRRLAVAISIAKLVTPSKHELATNGSSVNIQYNTSKNHDSVKYTSSFNLVQNNGRVSSTKSKGPRQFIAAVTNTL